MKFREKPVIIDAIQWTGMNANEIMDFIVDLDKYDIFSSGGLNTLTINTLEGEQKATINDWIIKGIADEFYPCKPDIFKKTYEEVN